MRRFEVTVFEWSLGDERRIVTRLSLEDSDTGEVLHTHSATDEESGFEAVALAIDAAAAWWRHGAMFAEPLESGWESGR